MNPLLRAHAALLRRWRDVAFAQKLAVLLITLVSLPTVVVVAYTTTTGRSALIAATRERNLERAYGTAAVIDAFFADARADLRTATALSDIVALCERPRDAAIRDHAIQSLDALRQHQGFLALYVTDRVGEVLASTDARAPIGSYQTGRAFLGAVAGDTLVDDPAFDPFDRNVVLRVSSAVRSASGEIIGTGVGVIDVGVVDTLVADDLDFGGNGEFGVLWTSNGLRLSDPAHPDRRFVSLSQSADDLIVQRQRLGPAFPDSQSVEPATADLVERGAWLLYDGGTDPHLRLETRRYGPLQATTVPLARQRWLYAILVPESQLLGALWAQILRQWAVAFFTVLAAFVLSLVAASWVTRPLRRVTDAANALARGDMRQRVGMQQRDELGQLSAAFDGMAAALAEKEQQLQAHAADLEQRVEERTAALQQANRMKDEFLGVVSHELRTPLNAIMGWTRLAAIPEQAGIERHKALDAVERNARALSRLVDDLLDVPRILTGKLALDLRPVDLVTVVGAAVDAVRPAAVAKGLALEAQYEVDAAPLEGDSQRLQQVFANLLSNAIKFTPARGSIVVRLASSGGAHVITIEDSGIGIHPEFLPFVFDRFRQADSSPSRAHGGLGIGLSIVRHLVELHGGHVIAASDGPDRGSTFTVTLPMHVADAVAGRGTAEPDIDPLEEHLRGMHGLVVDDDEDAREVVAMMLRASGATAVTASSVRAALDLLSRTPDAFTVVLADIGMPGQDGYAFIAAVRASTDARLRGLPVIAVTAYASAADRGRVLSAGFDEHVAKPVTIGRLTSVLLQVKEQSQPHRT